MFKSLRKSIAAVAAMMVMAAVPLAVPAVVSAQNIEESLKCGTTLKTDQTSGCSVEDGTTQVNSIITTIINVFSLVVGIVSVIMIIWGGFKYITSGGDSGNVTSAKNTIVYAVIGLVIVAMAQFIVQFVVGRVVDGSGEGL